MTTARVPRARLGATLIAFGALVGLGVPGVAQPTEPDGMAPRREMMQRMMPESLPPGIEPELLPAPRSAGARLLQKYCAQCHNLPGPGMHTAEEWPAVVERMTLRMNMHQQMMGGLDLPSATELKAITAYLQAHGLKPLPPSRYAELNAPGGEAFRNTCQQCHALPDPRLHTAEEWPAVVARMQRNMAAMRKPLPEGAIFRQITEFLARHGHEPEQRDGKKTE